jgi:hypothetical protein
LLYYLSTNIKMPVTKSNAKTMIEKVRWSAFLWIVSPMAIPTARNGNIHRIVLNVWVVKPESGLKYVRMK